MTDPTGLPPEQEAVRRLLADARHDGPTPPEVVARLDAALASLAAERGAPSPAATTHAPVVDLGARRRRMAGIGVLAAAAVVVAGVVIGQGLPQGGSDTGSAADSATSERDLAAEDSGAGAGSESGGGAESEEMAPQAKQSADAVPTISTADPDLTAQLADLEPSAGASRRGFGSTDESQAAPRYDAFCMLGIGPGRRLAADVDGQPGVLVFKPPSGDAQEVRIYVCGDGEAVRSLFLPLP